MVRYNCGHHGQLIIACLKRFSDGYSLKSEIIIAKTQWRYENPMLDIPDSDTMNHYTELLISLEDSENISKSRIYKAHAS